MAVPPNHAVRAFFGSFNGVLARLGVLSSIHISQAELDEVGQYIRNSYESWFLLGLLRFVSRAHDTCIFTPSYTGGGDAGDERREAAAAQRAG